ncbi:MAG: FN3 domain-containing metallophosphoesterase family protein [Coprobacillus sp.]
MKKKSQKKLLKISMATLAVLTGATSITALTSVQPVYADKVKTADSAQLINDKTVWKYLDTNVDPGADNRYVWTTAGYADTEWKSSAGKFGHKNGGLTDLGGGYIPNVLLQRYKNGVSGDVVPTYFFRTKVNVESIEDLGSITGTVIYDDAAIIYINGIEMTSFDKPTEGYETNMSYGGSNEGTPKIGEISISKDKLKDVLKVGENTISVEIHQGRSSSSDVYFEMKDLTINYGEQAIEQKALNLTVGEDETQMNLTWYANSGSGEVQFAKASAMENGVFPKQYSKVSAKSNLSNDALFNYHQATLTGLEENTKYVYRVVNGETQGELHYFTTKDFDGTYNFLLAGDPQIGSSGNASTDTTGWAKTLEYSVDKFNPNFIVSAGDQVNSAGSESEYTGYLSPEELTEVPQSTSVGNHDSGSSSYSQHYNLPNVSGQGATTASSDYYYVYNNTLFLNINTNNTSVAEHREFIKKAIEENQDVRWKVVTFHHSIYSVASHAVETGILNLRNSLVPVFDELGIDVVLMGHDHVYVRSHIMKNLKVTQNTDGLESVTDPDGILYVTANSASGSKFYNIKTDINMDFVAKKDQSKQRSISNIEVSDNEFKITTYSYNTDKNEWTTLDEFSVKKSVQTNDKEETLVSKDNSSVQVIAPAQTVPEGAALASSTITSGTLFEQVKSQMSNKTFEIIDLSLTKNDTKVDLLGNVKVQFDIPEGYQSQDLVIYRIKNNTLTRSSEIQLDKVEYEIVDGKAVITTDQMGQFILMNNASVQIPDTDDTTPGTGDTTPDIGVTPDGDGNQTTTPDVDIDNSKDTTTDTSNKESSTQQKSTTVKTNDNTEVLAFGILALATGSCAYVVTRKKKTEE